MLYEVALNISWYGFFRPAGGSHPQIATQGVDYATVVIEAVDEWHARHGAYRIAADKLRARYQEAYFGDSQLGRHTVRSAKPGAVVGTVKTLGTKPPSWVK